MSVMKIASLSFVCDDNGEGHAELSFRARILALFTVHFHSTQHHTSKFQISKSSSLPCPVA